VILLLKRFFPSEYVDSINHINYKKLYEEGYRGILFDVDNTLVPYDMEHPTKQIIDLFEEIKEIGFEIALVSNNNEVRITTFNEKLQVLAIHKALKPMTRNIKRAMQSLKLKKKNTILVGDQIFTDIYGGNRLKLKTILVVPISEKEQLITKIKRNTEKKILNYYLKKVKKNDSKN
jgi:HAD superfamily phosphatase (TIGR01668 family)